MQAIYIFSPPEQTSKNEPVNFFMNLWMRLMCYEMRQMTIFKFSYASYYAIIW